MNRMLVGLLLALAAGPALADCKQDCRTAYSECSNAAASADDTMRCKIAFKECLKNCDAAGLAAAQHRAADSKYQACGRGVPAPESDPVLAARSP